MICFQKSEAVLKTSKLILFIFCLLPLIGFSQANPIGTETLVNDITLGRQHQPAVAMDTSGNYTVVWNTEKNSIFAQRFNSNGSKNGAEISLIGNAYNPDIAMSDNGRSVLVYQRKGPSSNRYDVFGILMSSTGVLGTEFALTNNGPANQRLPTVGMDASGNFVAVWDDDYNITAQRFTNLGAPIGSTIVLDTPQTSFQSYPDIAVRPNGDFVVVWQSHDQDDSLSGVFGQQVLKDGTLKGTEFRANTFTTGNQLSPKVAIDTGGLFVVTWVSDEQDGDEEGVFMQLFDSNASPIGTESQVNQTSMGAQDNPDVKKKDNGNFVIAWNSYGQDGSFFGTYFQLFNKLGQPIYGEILANTTTTGFQQFPTIGLHEKNNLVLCWQDGQRNSISTLDGDDYGIALQNYSIGCSFECPSNLVDYFSSVCDFIMPDYTAMITLDSDCQAPVTITQDPAPGVQIFGDTTITFTISDASAIPGECMVQLDLQDTSKPILTCPNTIEGFFDANCQDTIPDIISMITSIDNCSTGGNITITQLTIPGPTITKDTMITIQAQDADGNISICKVLYSLQDTTSPTAVCQNITVFLDGSGNATITAADIDGGSSDNCGTANLSAPTTSFTCANLGPNNVTLTVDDGNGNMSTCVAVVTVSDTSSPVAVCQNITVFLDGSGNATITAADLDDGSSDNCGSPNLSASVTSFTCANLGANNVTLTVDDGNDNMSTCVAVVTVSDTSSPTAVCQNITIFLDGSGSATFTAADLDGGSSDNCGTTNLSASITAFTCANLGANNVTLTVDDGNGNMKTCVAVVTVSDTTSPVAVCQNITVFLDGTGNASITAAELDGGSSDNCGTTNLSASTTAFTCANLGANNVTLTVNDGNGNMNSCIAVVTVSDTTSPVAVCQNITVFLDGTGNASITTADLDGGSSDNCGTTNLSASITAFTCANLGVNNVTLTVDDGNGNMKSCVAVVTVSDTTSPVAVCQNITVFLDGAGNVTITAADLDGGSTDNCGSTNLSASTTAFTCANLGTNNVTLTVNDGNGNMKTCVAVITVSDTTSPIAVCQNITVFLDGSGNVTITAADLDGGSTDNCGTTSLSASTTTFTCANLGANNVTLTVDDGNGNMKTCVAVVSVVDTTSPVAVCQNITVFLDGSGNVTITAADLDGGSSDNCGIANLSASTTSFTCANLGANNVTLTVDDGNGNMSTCVAVVNVSDTTSPVAVCQNITVFLDGSGNATITAVDVNGGSSDNCGSTNLSASATSFTCANLGANNVTLTVDDGNGNMSTCVAVVSVSDTTSPTAVCHNITVFLDGSGNATITAADIDDVSSDNCGTANLSASTTSFTCANLGANNVTLTVDDGNGNMSTCVAVVTVSDTTPPTAVCQNITIFLDGSGNATITAADLDGGSTDNCATTNLSASTTSFTCANLGPSNVTLTVDDGNGNMSTCVAVVTVSDTTSPSAVCQNITVFLDGSGTATITAAELDGGSSDNCGTANFSASITAFTCANLGPNNVTLTVNDGNGNIKTCVAVVTVSDTISPMAVCQNITVFLDGTGNASITAADLDNGSSDNCGTTNLSASITAFTCANLGANNVTLTINDGNGNMKTCVAMVIVADTTSPIALCQNITVFLDGVGNASITAADLDGGSSDNCGTTNLSASITAFTCANLGANNVTLTVDDGNGNMESCVAVVTVSDTTSPVASCQNITIYLDGTGNVSISAADLDNGSSDNCGTTSLSASTTTFTCANLGTNNVTLTVDDGNGNASICTAVLTVSDTISPIAVCQDITVALDEMGTATISALDINNGSSDNCGGLQLSIPTTQFTCDDAGQTRSVILTVTDVNNNISTCSANVHVQSFDVSSPIIAGMSPICPSLKGVPYSIEANSDALSYLWTYSGTGVTINNNGSPSITLDFDENTTSGTLQVQYNTPCNPAGIFATKSIIKASVFTCSLTNNCLLENLLVLDAMISVPGGVNLFKASNRVSSFATIENAETVIFRAGQEIRLLPNFEVEQGAVFVAEIEGCFDLLKEEEIIQKKE